MAGLDKTTKKCLLFFLATPAPIAPRRGYGKIELNAVWRFFCRSVSALPCLRAHAAGLFYYCHYKSRKEKRKKARV
jgi:hypothetical protein